MKKAIYDVHVSAMKGVLTVTGGGFICSTDTLFPQSHLILIFTHLNLCLATAIHNFK